MPPNRSRQAPEPSSSPLRRSIMPFVFNTIRTSLYGTVLLFTVICLAMAGHFQHVLAASDLTRFVPFAIFVCTASLIIFIILLGFSLVLRERNPISTRIELACLALAGLFWLVLGVYLTSSESQSADVECFSSASATQPLDDSAAGFHTEQYQAMYRVLMTFSLINATLILLACIGLLILAVRRHKMGDDHMWHGPVTSCAWFNSYGNGVKRGNSGTSSILPIAGVSGAVSGGRKGYSERRSPYANGRPAGHTGTGSSKPLPNSPPMRQLSGNSGKSTLIGSHSTNEFERGNMMNPNVGRQTRGSR
ncbi:hypothetical protein D9615_000422 [Tricholomella constricta]|uniref:MARVEL domain-containing protein n=1 Tax=Tricholomella constricta TaxID=117010 RepID=A0A8H5MB87_9AGAR|nr:hypothetical protein D9615_000422 [Tricholomella constricta]